MTLILIILSAWFGLTPVENVLLLRIDSSEDGIKLMIPDSNPNDFHFYKSYYKGIKSIKETDIEIIVEMEVKS